MNRVFFGIIIASFIFAVINGTPKEVGTEAMNAAGTSVNLAISLIGMMALFLGLMKIVEEAGALRFMARVIRPVIVRLFPDVPPEHPAMGAMIMNMSANALGLGNAATPFGVKAMKELNTLNQEEGTATNAMVLFLAINTSGLALMPLGMITYRQITGSNDPAAIVPTTLMATAISTITGILAAKLLQRLPSYQAPDVQKKADQKIAEESAKARAESAKGRFSLSDKRLWCVLLALLPGALLLYVGTPQVNINDWIMPSLIAGMVLVGVVRRVPVYETFVAGAKEGFSIAVMIIPYLVAILVSISMLRASGGLELVTSWLGRFTMLIGLPPEVLPLAFLRPLSGSGSSGIVMDLLKTHGPDTLIGQLASTMSGSTETTFYVLAVYFGAVGVNKTRHAVPAGLLADFAGVLGSLLAVRWILLP